MYMNLCLSKYLESMVYHFRVQVCITEKRLPILSKLFLPFLPTAIKRRYGKLQPCILFGVSFRPLMERMLLLILADHAKKQASVFQNSLHLRIKLWS